MKYERLTDKKWKEIEKHCYAKGLYFSNQFTEEQTDEMIKRLAELEDKIESGKMLELPCKVGDNIYFVRVTLKPYIVETYIDEICFKKDYILVHCAESGRYLRFDNDWNLIENYWNVYLDKSKAEARLKELQGE